MKLKLNIQSQKHGSVFKEFDSQEVLDAYIAEVTLSQHWGKNAFVELIPAVVDEQGNELEPAQEIQHDSEWSYSVEDITAQSQIQQLETEGLTKQQIGAQVIAKIYAINELSNVSSQAFDLMLDDAQLAKIERMLWAGALGKAKAKIQLLDNTFFTQEQKDAILAFLAPYND